MKTTTTIFKGLLLMTLMGIQTTYAQIFSDRLTFSARLTAAPGVTTNANGVGAFMLNSTRDTMYFTTSASNLTSELNGFHIHNGRTGGNVVIDFDGKTQGTTVRSFITGTQLATLLPDFIEGNLYMAVHTVNNPSVEILGTIKLETDWGYAAMLDGMQAGSGSAAKGHSTVNFSMKGDTAIVRLATTGLTSTITGAHLHTGKVGQNGGVLIHFEDLIASDSLSLIGGVAINSTDWTALAAALMMDSIYLNIHTTNFAAGEIRGQLRTTKNLRFDTWLNQSDILATGLSVNKPSSAYGSVSLTLNKTMDTLHYMGVFNGLTSPLVGAHFHNASPMMNGPVVKDIDASIMGNTIEGIWTKYDNTSPLSSNFINELLMGNLYIVLHTDSNPATGEIRGNVMKAAREGLIAELDGMQSGSGSMGLGSAVATYDRDRTNLHVMLSCNGLQGTITSGHIHLGKRGESGPVAIDLGMLTNNGVYSILKSMDGFNDNVSIPIRTNDSSYINIHTTVFANGEIRGQLIRNYKISSPTMTTGVMEAGLIRNSIAAYPNPFVNEISLQFESTQNGMANFSIMDVNGKIVATQAATIVSGNNEVQLETSKLNRGFYIVELNLNNSESVRIKLMKN